MSLVCLLDDGRVHDIIVKMMRAERNVWFRACLEQELLVRSGAVGTSTHLYASGRSNTYSSRLASSDRLANNCQ